MNLNIICTSKPYDGLLYYSYEYSQYLEVPLIIITHPGFTHEDYKKAICEKYTVYEDVYFDEYTPGNEDTLILGRSILTLGYLNRHKYNEEQLLTLKMMFSNKLISVYSENHPIEYDLALSYFNPKEIIDLCDYDVYPNGVGKHFEKRINFSIYKEPVLDLQFENLFLGTNQIYYKTIEGLLPTVPGSYSIITYDADYVNKNLNNLFVPIKNLLGIFDTYVYTKPYFDPAPRLIQECMYFGKKILYNRDKSICDGGSVYYAREIKDISFEL